MSSVVYQNKAQSANSNIDSAKTSIDNAITFINSLISRIPSNNGYDALGRNTSESLTSIKSSLTNSTSSFESIKSSIMNKAIIEDRKLDMLKESEERDGNIDKRNLSI